MTPLPGDEEVATDIMRRAPLLGMYPKSEKVKEIATILAHHREQATAPLREAAQHLLNAVKFAGTKDFNGVECWDARVPVEFVDGMEKALSAHPTKAEALRSESVTPTMAVECAKQNLQPVEGRMYREISAYDANILLDYITKLEDRVTKAESLEADNG